MKTYILTDYGVKADANYLQTKEIQAVFDLCKKEGGKVVFPRGTYQAASLRMWSNMTLYFASGARLLGSEECDDYEVYEVPPQVELRTDMEMITQYYGTPWKEYRRAMISAYGEENIAIIGEADAMIDGRNCYDPNGEEHYRGPHGIFLTNCKKVTLHGYTIGHSGNFMHQLDKCEHVIMTNVTCLGGSDGIHLHCCNETLIEDCIFHTGDDCIAGINIRNLRVNRCELNTSCNLFRMGGVHIVVENCKMWGPGIYPHRVTIVKNRYEVLPQEAGRHNMIALLDYFASMNYPDIPSRDIVFRNCTVENLDHFLWYHADQKPLQCGTHLTELILENVTFQNQGFPSNVTASEEEPLIIKLKNVQVSYRDGGNTAAGLTDGQDPNTKIVLV
ncbi:MAG: right-handed parallel beta-helix repeat-containing protein [Clostridia bacterium]|nr:right-handed parallel beta-helix repeat-containing protein [Clostridia bacterium]